ncbi:MAG: diguanylate cyclase [Methylomicrobium sp.]
MIIDDDQTTIEVLNTILEQDYEVLFSTGGVGALALAKETRPDLILLDIVMPEIDGYQLCQRLKHDHVTRSIPVIFITELSDIAAELKGLQVGAIDYIAKPVSPPIVQMRVHNHIELKQARDSLALLAITDSLTGLANRRHFDSVLQAECERLSRLKQPLSLIMLDIDYFKNFNDTYGHIAGDHCLKQIAEAIRVSLLRPADLAARYGGEEFACILPHTEHSGALAIAERIQAAVAALKLPHAASAIADHVTVSLGVFTGFVAASTQAGRFVELADSQLYSAKAAGRNRIASQAAGLISPE